MKNTITKKMLAMMLAVMITAAPVSSVSFATEAPEGESTSVQQEVKVEKSEPAPAQESEKKEQAPAETSSAPVAPAAESNTQQAAPAAESNTQQAAPAVNSTAQQAPAEVKAEEPVKAAKSSYKVTIVVNGIKTTSGDTSYTTSATVSAKGTKTYSATTINSWIKSKSVHYDGATYKYGSALKDSSGNAVTSIVIKGAELDDDTTLTFTPVYSVTADMKVTVNFNNILKANGEVTSSTQSNTISAGGSWTFTQKKLDNLVTAKSFSYQGVKYEYAGVWVDENGNEVSSVTVKNTGEETSKIINLSPVYNQIKTKVLNFRYIDNISTGSGSWANKDEFSSYTHTFKQPAAKAHYKFVEWKNLEAGNTYNAGDKFSIKYSDLNEEVTEINVHAIWQPSVTVEYYGMNGLIKTVESTDTAIGAYDFTPAKADGAEFTGWMNGNDADAARVEEGTAYDLPAVTSSPVEQKVIKLYAQYITDYTVEHYTENLDGSYSLADSETVEDVVVGTNAKAAAKEFEGFTFNESAEGNLTEAAVSTGLTLKLYYDRNSYEVTYEYEGEVIPENADEQLPQTVSYKYGQEVPGADEPQIRGFEFNGWAGEVENMPAEDVTVTGSWTKIKEAPAADSSNDSDKTASGKTSKASNKSAARTDAAQQTVTALADNEAPKAASEQISDSSVPMTIADNETPTAAPEAWALINLLCAVATAILSVIMLIGMFGRREDEDEETGESLEIRHRRAARVFSIFPAIGAIAAFLITEDMANPMVLTDNWTIVMAVILMIQIAVSVIAKKKKEEEEEYNTIG